MVWRALAFQKFRHFQAFRSLDPGLRVTSWVSVGFYIGANKGCRRKATACAKAIAMDAGDWIESPKLQTSEKLGSRTRKKIFDSWGMV